jgi:hypothetical protein
LVVRKKTSFPSGFDLRKYREMLGRLKRLGHLIKRPVTTNQEKIFFVHIPSSAGTTFWTILRSVYGIDRVKRIPRKKFENIVKRSQDSRILELNKKNDVIGGHIPYYLVRNKFPDHRMISFLRDPVRITISAYSRRVRNGKWTPDPKLGAYDIVEFQKHRKLWALTYLSALSPQHEVSPKQVMAVLEKNFAFIGITEDFNRSMFLLQRVLGFPEVPLYDRRNIGGNKSEHISEEVYQKLVNMHEFDYRVFEFARQLFEIRWAEYCSDITAADLAEYENRIKVREQALLEKHGGKSPYIKTA